MLTRGRRESQQNICLTKMLTRGRKESQQNVCLAKMLTQGHRESQQNICLAKMLTRGRLKRQQNVCLPKMLTLERLKRQQNSCLPKGALCIHAGIRKGADAVHIAPLIRMVLCYYARKSYLLITSSAISASSSRESAPSICIS